MMYPQCNRNLPSATMFSNPKGVGWQIKCSCGFRIITDTYKNLVDANLADELVK